MRRALLDVGVLVALLDTDHADHERVGHWIDARPQARWASCAITENGAVRILSQPRYPNPVSPEQAVGLLAGARVRTDHEFWPCEVSVLDDAVVDASRLHGPRQVTDAYLLALAVARDGVLATLDRSIPLSCVRGARDEHLGVI